MELINFVVTIEECFEIQLLDKLDSIESFEDMTVKQFCKYIVKKIEKGGCCYDTDE